MGIILHILSEDVAWINYAWDVFQVNIIWLMILSNHVLSEISMLDSFRCDWICPLDASLSAIVYFCLIVWFRHSDVIGTILEMLKFCGTFIGRHYLCFSVTERCLIMAYRFPGNGTSRAENYKTRWWIKFEKFYRCYLINCSTKLTA